MHPFAVRRLHDALAYTAERVPKKIAIIADGQPYTYEALLGEAKAVASTLMARGFERGDRVAIYMENSFSLIAVLYGTLMAGGVFLVVNPQTKEDKLSFILDDSGAKFMFVDGYFAHNFVPALSKPNQVGVLIVRGTQPVPNAVAQPVIALDEIDRSSIGPIDGKTIELDLAALIYTSGTTGHPKGVMHTHRSIGFAIHSIIEYLDIDESHRILNVLPLAFGYGLTHVFMTMRLGATLILERSFSYPAQVLNRLTEHEGTMIGAVPTIYSTLLSMHAKKPLCFPLVTRLTNAAAALPASFVAGLGEIFPNASLFAMYGQTECFRTAYLDPSLIASHPTSVGRPIPGTEVELRDADGRAVPQGEPGILHVRGPHVTVGYWNLPDKTRELLRDGPLPGERILCTNDWFRFDEFGRLYFVSRNDDIIKIRGEKVSPIEVENVLHSIEGVREAAVIGIPDERMGHAIRAYIAKEEGSPLTEKDVQKVCLARLENFMVPKEVVFLAELPKTQSGKIRKKSLEPSDSE
ncbi:MAG: acyl--CoA ligase [Deltaproteobacteria bacterium]|nr:acyl--CoA ligase [Deltaproteobacteria bacterium]